MDVGSLVTLLITQGITLSFLSLTETCESRLDSLVAELWSLTDAP
jgi:hypothetical protein